MTAVSDSTGNEKSRRPLLRAVSSASVARRETDREVEGGKEGRGWGERDGNGQGRKSARDRSAHALGVRWDFEPGAAYTAARAVGS